MTVPSSYAYQWARNGTPISGATSSTYTCVTADIGDTITCVVTGTNAAGSVPTVTAPTSPVVVTLGVPVNSAVPVVSNTAPTVGTAITATNGTWSNSPASYTDQWYYYTPPVAPSTGAVAPIQTKPVVTGTSSTISIPLSTAVGASHLLVMDSVQFDNIAVSAISGGGMWTKDASTASSTAGTLERWYCLNATGGATTVSVTLASTPGANRGTFMVTEYPGTWAVPTSTPTSNGGPSSTPTSASVTPSEAGDLLLSSMTAGTALSPQTGPSTGWAEITYFFPQVSYYVADVAYQVAGSTTALNCNWSVGSSVAWSTLISKFTPASTVGATYTAIAGATSATYTPVTADLNKPLACGVTATNSSGTSTVTYSASTANVTPAPVLPALVTAPVVTGALTAGSVLTASAGVWNNNPISYAYQWLRDGTAISGSTTATYTLLSSDLTHAITCQVTATNGAGSASSTSTVSAGAPTSVTIIPPSDGGWHNVVSAGADPTGAVDCTSIVQGLITANIGGNNEEPCVIYFPSGTYKISNTLYAKNNGGNGGWRGYLTFQGENAANTTIKMVDNVWTTPSTYGGQFPSNSGSTRSDGTENAMLYFTTYGNITGNNAICNFVYDLTLDIGNNPAGVACSFLANNIAAVRRVNFKGTGFIGIDLGRGQTGPGIITDCNFTGTFAMPWITYGQEYSWIMERCTVSTNSPGGYSGYQGFVMGIKDCNFVQPIYEVSAASDTVYWNSPNIQDTNTQGARVMQLAPGVAGYKIPSVDTPLVAYDDPSQWANVTAYSSIQAALNSGKSTIYFPANQAIGIPPGLIVPSTVNRIIGMGWGPVPSSWDPNTPFFTTSGTSSTPLTFERNSAQPGHSPDQNTYVLIQHASTRDLVVIDWCGFGTVQGVAGGGRIFFDNTTMNCNLVPGNQLYARQWNYEDPYLTCFNNNGGQAWIFGFKTEWGLVSGQSTSNFKPSFVCSNGSRTDMCVGFSLPNSGVPSTLTQFNFANSSYALTWVDWLPSGTSASQEWTVDVASSPAGNVNRTALPNTNGFRCVAALSYNGG